MTEEIRRAVDSLRSDLLDSCRHVEGATGWVTVQPSAEGRPIFTTGNSLYSGSLGVAVFLAAVDAHDGENRGFDTVRGVARPFLSQSDDQFLADDTLGMSGIGGAIYGLELLTRYTGDSRFRNRALSLVETAAADHANTTTHGELSPIDEYCTRSPDFAHGTAGLLAAVLSLPDQSVPPSFLTALGDTLVSRQQSDGPYAGGWPGSDATSTVGLAHGSHGIALALGKLYDRTGKDRYAESVTDALSFARSARVEEGWTVSPRSNQTETRFGWCWGSAGIGLALLDIGRTTGIEEPGAVEHAVETTCGHEVDSDCLCHGTASTLALLVRNERGVDRASSRQYARKHLLGGDHGYDLRHDQHGVVFRPSMMIGRAGIGYQLLRCIEPTETHAITLFE